MALLYIFINFGVYHLSAKNSVNINQFTILSLTIGFVLILLFAYCRWKNYEIAKCFIPVALLCGIMFMAVTPVFRGPDEELHFYRAYEVSAGYALSDMQNGVGGRQLPSSLKSATPDNTLEFNFSNLKENAKIPLNKEKIEFIPFSTAALYSPIQYFPQSIGIFVGRTLNLNPIYIAYLGRLTNFIIWLLICFLALKNLKGMPLIFLIALLPMSLHMATTLSPDALTNSISMLFISYIVRISYFEKDKQITMLNLRLVFAMAITISLCKIVYLPLCLFFLIVPLKKFKSKKSFILSQAILILSCFMVNIIWLCSSFGYLTDVNEGVNAAGQIAYILSNPIQFLNIILATTASYFNVYIHSMVGANLCLFDVPIYYWVSNCYLLLLIYMAFNVNIFDAKKFDKYIVLVISAAIFLLINISLYIQWMPVGKLLIDGIQGRYFLPLLPFLLFAFKPKKNVNIDKAIVVSSIFLTYPVLVTLLLKHLH